FPVSALNALSQSNGSVTYGTSLGLYGLMTINTDSGPMGDLRIREAVELAIDYEGIRDGVFASAAEVNKTFTPKAAWGYSEAIYQTAWDQVEAGATDLDRAQALVEDAGAPAEPIVLAYFAE